MSDVNGKKLGQYIVAVISTTGALACGCCIGWSAPAGPQLVAYENLPFYGFTVNGNELSWIGSLLALGAAAASIPMPILIKLHGRKRSMLLLIIPFLIGWGFIIYARSVVMICIGRFVTGICVGAYYIAAPPYLAEIAEQHIRGRICSFFQLMITVGILIVYALGTSFSVFSMSLICAFISVIFVIFFSLMPESPIFYVSKRRDTDAIRSILRLRGSKFDCVVELIRLKKEVAQQIASNKTCKQILQLKSNQRAAAIGFGLIVFQQATGINIMVFYATEIFEEGQTSLEPNTATLIFGVVQVVFTFISFIIIDKTGRKLLLISSITVLAVCNCLLGLYFSSLDSNAESISSISWFPVVILAIYMMFYSTGMGPVVWVITGEIFGNEIKNVALAGCSLLSWLCSFAVSKTYYLLRQEIGMSVTFGLYAILSFVGVFFIYFVVPETNGYSLFEIQQMLEESPLEHVPETEHQA